MKINTTMNHLFAENMEKMESPNRIITEVLNEKFKNSVEVTISERGQEYYRKNIQDAIEDTDSYEDMIEQRNRILENKLSPVIVHSFRLGEELSLFNKDGTYSPIKEKAGNLLKAYANIYHEIVQGYEDGTREMYVEDKNSDDGYRKLTKEEEIDALNDAYKRYAEGIEMQEQQASKFLYSFEKYMEKLHKIKAKMPSMAQMYYDGEYLSRKKEIIPNNISQKMLDASTLFVSQYSAVAISEKNIQSLLSKISIF